MFEFNQCNVNQPNKKYYCYRKASGRKKLKFFSGKFAFIQFPPSCNAEIKYLSFANRTEISSFSYDDIKIPIRFCRHKDSKLTMFISHRNGEDMGHDDTYQIAREFGVNVCMFDYSGYGMHSLKTSSEEDCYKDV
jgi:hypothetical protein